MVDPANFKRKAFDDTRVFREYMVKESLQQYRDYYETDGEEIGFLQYMGDMTNRDKIRFSENFDDYIQVKQDNKDFVQILKREYNPELSVFSNLILDLQDFKDRVRPLARDISLMDVTRKHQKHNVATLRKEFDEIRKEIQKQTSDFEKGSIEEGYSSRELEEGKK